ncbi:MAG: hypothetical protein ACK53V_14930, partial [Planctomycetota bacterium]
MLLLQGAAATIEPQQLLQAVARRLLKRPLQAVAQPVLQPELQAVAQPVLQPVLQGVEATTVLQPVLQGVEATTVPQPVSQLLAGVAQRAEVRLARQVATRPERTRPPIRLPLSQ